jgi:hypothetical protein
MKDYGTGRATTSMMLDGAMLVAVVGTVLVVPLALLLLLR